MAKWLRIKKLKEGKKKKMKNKAKGSTEKEIEEGQYGDPLLSSDDEEEDSTMEATKTWELGGVAWFVYTI